MQAREQTIEQDVTGFSGEDAIEAGAQGAGLLGIGIAFVEFEILVDHQIRVRATSTALRWAGLVGGELVDQPLGMDPACVRKALERSAECRT